MSNVVHGTHVSFLMIAKQNKNAWLSSGNVHAFWSHPIITISNPYYGIWFYQLEIYDEVDHDSIGKSCGFFGWQSVVCVCFREFVLVVSVFNNMLTGVIQCDIYYMQVHACILPINYSIYDMLVRASLRPSSIYHFLEFILITHASHILQ